MTRNCLLNDRVSNEMTNQHTKIDEKYPNHIKVFLPNEGIIDNHLVKRAIVMETHEDSQGHVIEGSAVDIGLIFAMKKCLTYESEIGAASRATVQHLNLPDR